MCHVLTFQKIIIREKEGCILDNNNNNNRFIISTINPSTGKVCW